MASNIASLPQPVADLDESDPSLLWEEVPDPVEDNARGLKGAFTGIVLGSAIWCMILFLAGVIRL